MQMISTNVEPKECCDYPSYDPRPCLYLTSELVEKLGLKGIPAPGTTFMLQAKVVAESVTARAETSDEAEDKTPDVSLSLVFVEMGLATAAPTGPDAATMLYGGS